jgi:hypothetical protein
MGKINNYQTQTPSPGDRILGSADSNGSTKNFTVQSIADLQTSQTIYRAYINQSGSSAPVATELPGNTLAGTWEYDGTGIYIFKSIGSFIDVKVGVICSILTGYNFSVVDDGYNDDELYILTYNGNTLTDNILSNRYIEIFTHAI